MEWHKQEQHLLVGTSDSANGNIGQLKIKLQNKHALIDKYDCPDPAAFIRQNVDPHSASSVIFTRRYGRSMNKKLAWVGFNVTWWLGRLFRGIGPKHLQAYLDLYCYLYNRNRNSLFDCLLKDSVSFKRITCRELIGYEPVPRSNRPPRAPRNLITTTG
ncbi:hypothetical protein [Cohnella endophytica]|nr:hypothetical protein [Cohnella endophytica]